MTALLLFAALMHGPRHAAHTQPAAVSSGYCQPGPLITNPVCVGLPKPPPPRFW